MNIEIKRRVLSRYLLPAPAYLVFAVVAALAQSAPSPTRETDEKSKPDEMVTLSPFQVSGVNDHGYGVSNTVGATRVNIALTDVPQSITVINREFIKDTAYSDLVVLPDGDILCIYEGGEKGPYESIGMARLGKDWLGGKRTSK